MTASKRSLAFFLALCLLAMLGASLWQRFTSPSLTISRVAGMNPSEGRSEIGALMEQAGKNPNDRAVLLRLVEQLMAIGQWQGAENFAHRALNLDPARPDSRAMYLLAVIHHNQGRHREAAELLEKLLAREENPSARYSLGILYLHFLNNPEAGIAQMNKGLQNRETAPALAAAMREELEKAGARLPAPPSSPEPSQSGEQ